MKKANNVPRVTILPYLSAMSNQVSNLDRENSPLAYKECGKHLQASKAAQEQEASNIKRGHHLYLTSAM